MLCYHLNPFVAFELLKATTTARSLASAVLAYCTPRLVARVNNCAAEDFKTIRSEIIDLIISILLTPNLQLIVYELQPLNYLLDSLSAVEVIRVLKEPRTHTLPGNHHQMLVPPSAPTSRPPPNF